MSFKTTALLLVLVVAVGAGWIALSLLRPDAHVEPPAILTRDVKAALTGEKTDKAARIVLEFGDKKVEKVQLDRKAGAKVWTMPGNWPTRAAEVKELTGLLAGLESRFVPIALTKENRKEFARPAVTITVTVDGKDQVLKLGHLATRADSTAQGEDEPANSFYQPTFLRLDDKDEAIRLAPGLVDRLRHPAQYYQQRWLFLPPEKTIRDGETPDKTGKQEGVKVIRLIRKKDAPVKGYALAWSGTGWTLTEPFEDRVDPEKLKSILDAVPDLWVERFVDNNDKKLVGYDWKNPEAELSVTRADGGTVTLLIGIESRVETRMEMPPPPPFGAPPRPPQPRIIREEYHFAKLKESKQASSQIFEIKAVRLNKDLLVLPDSLRDPKLARFESRNARKVELTWAGKKIVMTKDGFTWKLEGAGGSAKQEADESKITELLDKLAGLEAKDADVLDGVKPEDYGLKSPAGTIAVTVEEEVKGKDDAKTKKTRVFHFKLGKRDAEKKKLYVKVDDGKRINAVDDALFTLASRPVLVYRGRKILSIAGPDLAGIDVRRPTDPYVLEKVKNTWRLKAPMQADVESNQIDRLADDLGQLEAVEFVADSAKPDDLDKVYGLGKSALSARLTFADAKKKAETILVGKQRPGKQDYFAKLEAAPGIFAVKKEIQEALAKASLAYRPLELWRLQPDEIGELRILKEEPEYRLKRDGMAWKVTAPFQAVAVATEVKPLADELAAVRCERFEAHFAKTLETYGLVKPYLRVTLTPVAKKAGDKKDDKKEAIKEDKKEIKERVLLIGKAVDKGKGRYAKLGDGEAIFVLGEKTIAALDRSPYDFLDRGLLSLDPKTIQKIRRTAPEQKPLALELKKDAWRVTESPAGDFAADQEVADALLQLWTGLKAKKIAAYSPKEADLVKLGLKTPAFKITITTLGPDKKSKDHVLTLGAPPPDGKEERYARLDNGPAVAVLDAATVRLLTQGYLDFVDRSVLKLDFAMVTGLERKQGAETLEIVKQGSSWKLVKPAAFPADKLTLDLLMDSLSALRAKGVAAFPAKDLKKFGLDNPTVVTIRLTGADKKPVEHVIKIGALNDAPAAKDSGERFALVDKSTAVVVLPGDLARALTGKIVHFRDRSLPALAGAERVVVKRGSREATFTRTDDTWKMTAPVEADAEQAALEAIIKTLAMARAAEVVDDKPTDLKTYGLDKPEATWQFFQGGKEVLGLAIGTEEKGAKTPGRRYARLTGSPLVFLLDADLTASALAEYRARKVWDAPDAAQVDRIRFGSRAQPFTLVKVDSAWKIEGMETVAVKADAVKDTLAALADLKAERYLADKAADLELYGLKPAQVEVEVSTPTGKKVLYIGKQEGGSKRYYARAADGDQAPVFLISETDAPRIVRRLKDFTEKPAK